MNAKSLSTRRMSAAIVASLVGLGLFASWRAEAGKSSVAAGEPVVVAAVVQDKDADAGLQTKLFLHRQGYFAQPSGRSSK
ncbi:MAG: hypothetical protein JSR40_04650 [Proteobacteria bacterium]|nr:hypothetical protein [Pseudomonadota bacterium]